MDWVNRRAEMKIEALQEFHTSDSEFELHESDYSIHSESDEGSQKLTELTERFLKATDDHISRIFNGTDYGHNHDDLFVNSCRSAFRWLKLVSD